ncbi:MAG TPA: ParB/RepB/Spo0J family partition protein, partial [Anaerolineae bacterium]|nr:ParB/RepB/Spo0J family partition protein [Anaerolineae bacterium]
MTTTLTAISIDSIRRGDNDRQAFDQVALEELSESIRTHGLVQPITIRPMTDGHYEIVAGERRWLACKLLTWHEIPAIVRDLDDEAASAIMLAENIGRKELTPIEEANAYRRRIDQFGWSETQVAGVAGVSLDLVRRRLSLLQLVPEAQTLVGS